MKNSIIILIMLSILSMYSCKHEPEIKIPDNQDIDDDPVVQDTTETCDSTVVYFVNEVLPIFESSCATTGCHNAASQQDGVNLTTYQNIVSTGGVVVNNAANSEVYQVLTASGNDLMPPSSSGMVLSQTQIDLIGNWINEGAQNNECENMCDTTNFAYAANVKPLLDASCVSCHNTGSTNGTVLATYNDVKANVDNGKLLASIMHSTGTSPMPKDLAKWDDCKITIIEKWINDGAPNN